MNTSHKLHRREFLGVLPTSLAAAGIGVSAFAGQEPAPPNLAPVQPEIEPIVRLIEETPREKILPVIAERLKRGLSYRQLLAGVFLTAIRNRTSTHHVLMMHSIHQTSLDVEPQDRFLPLLWALNSVKSVTETNPILKPLKDGQLPSASKAPTHFSEAMMESDFESADRALVAVARSQGPRAAYEHVWRWGAARNGGSNVGHAAIAVANTYRTLHAIGWQHAEPALRYALWGCMEDKGRGELHRLNAQRSRSAVSGLPPTWAGGRTDRGAVIDLVALFREAESGAACGKVFDLLREGNVQAATVWDALLLVTAEMALASNEGGGSNRHRHSVTMTNGLHYIFRTSNDPELRLYALLEAVEWVTKFQSIVRAQKSLRSFRLTDLKTTPDFQPGQASVEQILDVLPPRRSRHSFRDLSGQDKAMQLIFDLAAQRSANPFLHAIRGMMCRKSRGSHDFKYPVAIFEHFRLVSPEWKPHVLAASVVQLQGRRIEDNPSLVQAREILRG